MVGWQVPVCGLIIIIPAIGALLVILRVETPHLNASDLWIPCWRGLNPVWLLVYRALVFSFMSCLLYRVAAIDGTFAFYFYTQWTFALVIIYFAIGTVISAHGCWKHLQKSSIKDEEQDFFLGKDPEGQPTVSITSRIKDFENMKDPEGQPTVSITSRIKDFGYTIRLQHHQEEVTVRAGFWGYLMHIVYQTCAGAVMLTDIVFWCLLFPFQSGGGFGLTALMVCMHSLNLLFLLVDTVLNKLTFPWFRMAYFVFWSCIYIVFQWTVHAFGVSWWPYAFLDLSTSWAPMWYLAIALIHIPCYGFYVLIGKLKNSVALKLFPDTFLRSC